MSTDPRLLDLLARWEELRAAGEEPTPEDLCRHHPDLLDALREHMRRLENLDSMISATRIGDPAVHEEHPAGSADRRFEPVRLHARGGLGEVYVARDTQLNREV